MVDTAPAVPRPLVVIVDDNPMVCDALLRLLEADGYRVIASVTPWEVPMLLEAVDASLVITDVLMPGVDGLSLIRRIRSTESLRKLPVIALSGMDTELDAMRAGASAFVAKDSLDWPELRREVRRLAGPGVRT